MSDPSRGPDPSSCSPLLTDIDDPVHAWMSETVVIQGIRRVHRDLEGERSVHHVVVGHTRVEGGPAAGTRDAAMRDLFVAHMG